MMTMADEALDYLKSETARWKEVGDRLKNIRKHNGMTQSELANELGLSRAQIANIEGGRHMITTENLIAVCRLFGVTSDGMLGLTKLKVNETKMRLATAEERLRKIKRILEQ